MVHVRLKNLTFLAVVGLFLGLNSVLHATSVEDGWKALAANQDERAKEYFLKALSSDPNNLRALIGMAYTHEMMQQDTIAWQYYQKALSTAPDANPYIYASILSRRFQININNPNSGISKTLRLPIDKPDSLGILTAMAWEQLGGMAEAKGQIKEAIRLYSNIDAVTKWRLIGPFENISASGFDRRFSPEQYDSPDTVLQGTSGGLIRWFEPAVYRNDHWVDIARYFPSIRGMFFATTYVYSPVEQRVHARLGTSGSFKLFINDSVVHESFDEYNNDLDTYISEVTLHQGWNRVLIKVGSSELNRCNFLFRVTDMHGKSVKGLEYSTEKQQYTIAKNSAVRLPNVYTKYFQEQVAAAPSNLENHLLLAECFLRNDHVSDAERVLREATIRFPNCIPLLLLKLDAYSRGSKRDEYVSTMELISSLRPDIPTSLSYTFQTALAADRVEDATVALENIERTMPKTQLYFDCALDLARKRDRIQEITTLTIEAFQYYPQRADYAAANAGIALQSEGRHNAAIRIVQRHLDAIYSEQGLLMMANILRDAGRIEDWQKIFDKLYEYQPAAPGYYVAQSEVFASRKDFGKSLEYVKKALEISPGVSGLWVRAGSLYRTTYDKDGAISCYKRAIEFDPANFDARDLLRDVTGQLSPLSEMPSTNIDSLIAAAPPSSNYQDVPAVYLLDESRRIVYDGSRCEVFRDIVLRIESVEGIDDLKEFNVPYSGLGDLTIDKAVVRKPNGKEIPADRSGGYLVFKGLEVGDIILVKSKVRESMSGRMAKHFWDNFSFNSSYPVRLARLSILTRANEPLSWNVRNNGPSPLEKETPFGKLWVWEAKDQPAIEPEEGMPSYSEVVKNVSVTSMTGWWEIADWYYDIARTKSRSSYEISEVMDSLFPRTKSYTESQIMEGVYNYITKHIRYSNVPFRQSGIVPQKARDVLVTRIGDCKDVASLCIAMLNERNISAYHVLVQTNTAGIYTQPLPSIPFDHCIVYAVIDGKDRFADLTAAHVPMGSLPFGDVDAFALIIRQGSRAPLRLLRQNLIPSNAITSTKIILNPDASARITQEFQNSGSLTQLYRSAWADKPRKELERNLNESLSEDFSDITLESFDIQHLNDLDPTISYTLQYTVPNYVTEAGDFLIMRLPWIGDFKPNAALSYDKRNYPYEYNRLQDTITETISITIPSGYIASNLAKPLLKSTKHLHYELSSDVEGNVITLRRVSSFKSDFITPEDYPVFKATYNEIVRADRQALLLMPKGTVVKKLKSK